MSVKELADECRSLARDVVNRHQKNSSLELYRVLARCAVLCDVVRQSNSAREELRALIAASSQRRSYVERDSDEFTLCCRYVFAGDESHANMSRYASSLREAHKLAVRHDELFAWLSKNGGVNALHMRRPNQREHVSTKCLRLDRSIRVPKQGQFTVTLQRDINNVYTVIEAPDEDV